MEYVAYFIVPVVAWMYFYKENTKIIKIVYSNYTRLSFGKTMLHCLHCYSKYCNTLLDKTLIFLTASDPVNI